MVLHIRRHSFLLFSLSAPLERSLGGRPSGTRELWSVTFSTGVYRQQARGGGEEESVAPSQLGATDFALEGLHFVAQA